MTVIMITVNVSVFIQKSNCHTKQKMQSSWPQEAIKQKRKNIFYRAQKLFFESMVSCPRQYLRGCAQSTITWKMSAKIRISCTNHVTEI